MIRTVVVEDEAGARMRYCDLIDSYGEPYKLVGSYASGREAIADWGTSHPNLVFTDVRMPHMSGLEFVENRRAAGWSGVAVVISGYGEFSFAQEAIRAGVYDYLLKPIFPEDLSELLERICHDAFDAEGTLARRALADTELTALSDHVRRAIRFVETHVEERISLSGAAAAAFLSPAHLSAVFTRECGITFVEFLHHVRVEKAKLLLGNRDLTLLDVAEQSGLSDRSYLNRIFKRITGMSPGAYRTALFNGGN